MSADTRKLILVDTNVALEAYRVGCLKPLCTHHRIVMVTKCVEETQTGLHLRDSSDTIPIDLLRSSLAEIPEVSRRGLAALDLRLPNGPYLDDGEKHLLAHALERADSFLLCGPDKAMVRGAHKLGMIERLVSLEQIAKEAHVAKRQLGKLGTHFRSVWLEEERTKALMGLIT